MEGSLTDDEAGRILALGPAPDVAQEMGSNPRDCSLYREPGDFTPLFLSAVGHRTGWSHTSGWHRSRTVGHPHRIARSQGLTDPHWNAFRGSRGCFGPVG